jgi:glucose-1-phosphatase
VDNKGILMDNMTKTVALDIGGVCLNLHYDLCFDYFGYSMDKPMPEAVMNAVEQYERGLINEAEWLESFRVHVRADISDEDIRHGWNLIIGQDITGIAKWIREMIANGYRFIYFSDTSQLHLLEVCRNFSAAHLIYGGIFSFDVKAKKPEAAMYEAFETQYGKPDLYLDDRQDNIAGGSEFGWNSQLFTSVEDLRKTL